MRIWTDERDAVLRGLWERGLTGKEIAAAMGISRNAAIGRAHRLKVAGRPSPIKTDAASQEAKAERNRKRRVRRQAAQKPRPKPKPRLPTKAVKPSSLAPERRSEIARTAYPAPAGYRGRTCCWPLWGNQERPTHQFCGGPAVPDRPYCEFHCRAAYRRAEEAA